MPYYRKERIRKKLAINAAKCAVLVGAAVWLGIALDSAPVEGMPPEPDALSRVGTSVQGPMPIFGPPSAAEAVAGPPKPEPPAPDPTVACGSFAEPAEGVLTSVFGQRWGRNHNGIDIGGTRGSSILAADGGQVTLAGWVDGYGNYVVIDHENGYETAYGHCQELLVSQGERVAQGQCIALMGSTGNSTGPHLHFEIKANGTYQNPLNYVLY